MAQRREQRSGSPRRTSRTLQRQPPNLLTREEIRAIIDSLGDVGASLGKANPEGLQGINRNLRVEMIYDQESRAADVKIRPLGGLVNVSEGGR